MKRTVAVTALATLIAGAGIIGIGSPAHAAVPSCVGKRSSAYYYSVYVDNACTTSQRVKVDWGWAAPDSSCRTLAAKTTKTISADPAWRASSQYSGLKSC